MKNYPFPFLFAMTVRSKIFLEAIAPVDNERPRVALVELDNDEQEVCRILFDSLELEGFLDAVAREYPRKVEGASEDGVPVFVGRYWIVNLFVLSKDVQISRFSIIRAREWIVEEFSSWAREICLIREEK